jgi:hypothetical protein
MTDVQMTAPACEWLIGVYDKMISATFGDAPRLRALYDMVLESEILDRWPVAHRHQLIVMFEDAIRLAEDDGSGMTRH